MRSGRLGHYLLATKLYNSKPPEKDREKDSHITSLQTATALDILRRISIRPKTTRRPVLSKATCGGSSVKFTNITPVKGRGSARRNYPPTIVSYIFPCSGLETVLLSTPVCRWNIFPFAQHPSLSCTPPAAGRKGAEVVLQRHGEPAGPITVPGDLWF